MNYFLDDSFHSPGPIQVQSKYSGWDKYSISALDSMRMGISRFPFRNTLPVPLHRRAFNSSSLRRRAQTAELNSNIPFCSSSVGNRISTSPVIRFQNVHLPSVVSMMWGLTRYNESRKASSSSGVLNERCLSPIVSLSAYIRLIWSQLIKKLQKIDWGKLPPRKYPAPEKSGHSTVGFSFVVGKYSEFQPATKPSIVFMGLIMPLAGLFASALSGGVR